MFRIHEHKLKAYFDRLCTSTGRLSTCGTGRLSTCGSGSCLPVVLVGCLPVVVVVVYLW